MTKISNKVAYAIKSPIIGTDYFPITNSVNAGVGMAIGATKSADFNGVREFVIAGLNPEIGGNLKFTEIEYNGVLTSPASVANALDPDYTVAQYEVLFFNINGNKYILKLQDVTIGDTSPNISDSDFIKILAFTQLGDGTPILKGYNVATGNHEFYAIKSTGLDISIVTGNVVIEKKAGSNLGNGIAVYKGLNGTTKIDEFYNLKSSTLNISKEIVDDEETGNVLINTPETASIPGLYVNNLYKPTYEDWVSGGGNLISNPSFLYKGEGTLSKPFTDSRNYTTTTAFTDTANTAIQNALDAYVGADPLNPAKLGQQIIVQNNIVGYTHPGDFNYSGLSIKLEANILSTNTDYIVDMDNNAKFKSALDACTFNIDANRNLTIEGKGFKNNGNTVATNNFTSYRQVRLFGSGVIASTGTDITKYILSSDINSNGNGTTGFNNDGAWQFEVRCFILSNFQGLYKIGGKGRIYNFGASYQSGNTATNVNTSLKAFYQKGGVLRFFERSSIAIYGNASTVRDVAFEFEPTNGFVPDFIANGLDFIGETDVLFNKNNSSNVTFSFIGSISPNMGTEYIFGSPNLWGVDFKNNIFGSGAIDTTKADLTQGNNVSCTNTIGQSLVESLVYFTSKQNAKSSGLPINSAYLLKRDVNAGSLIVGTEYKIKTAGTGTPLGTEGDYFVAANDGSLAIDGVATIVERCVMV